MAARSSPWTPAADQRERADIGESVVITAILLRIGSVLTACRRRCDIARR
ncbi:hypothetical protein [Kitasatospora kifunensis]|uniref:Uncharacterized protein n=1 Tax=Kitasatospora kifunensis TaxID=58351 RepID=A0A7W7RB85_KITKI|nr:hypothetical protein [Kitasatospora kifunensis]MBB4928744.1 hypothetical protein [Kitasatospora kifunensis]